MAAGLAKCRSTVSATAPGLRHGLHPDEQVRPRGLRKPFVGLT
jgi:hypothetical protein